MNSVGQRLVWIDLETSGLDPHTDKILEIGAVITEQDLTVVAQSSWVVNDDCALLTADSFVIDMHKKSGLYNAVLGPSSIPFEDAADELLMFVRMHTERRCSPLCGNSVGALERPFLSVHIPRLLTALHYRMIDVSTIKELVKRWRPDLIFDQDKKLAHRALSDVFESIEELKRYRDSLFVGAR